MTKKKLNPKTPNESKNGLKLKDPDVRQQAFNEYCEWLAKGKSSRSFTFESDLLSCTGQTIESYIKNNPTEFPSYKKEIAFNKGLAKWEMVVEESADGKNKDANTASLQMLMRNKYGWDRKEKEAEKTNPYIEIVNGISAVSEDSSGENAH